MSSPLDPYYEWLGIQPKDQPPNHYRLLGIELFEPNPDVIQRAADRQMAHLRTFQTGPHSSLSQQLLNEVAAAKVCLLKPDKREAYDAALRAQLFQVQAQPATPPRRAWPSPSLPVLAAIGGTVGLVLAIGLMLLLSGKEPSPEPAAVVARSEPTRQPAPGTAEPAVPSESPSSAPAPATAPQAGATASRESKPPSPKSPAEPIGDPRNLSQNYHSQPGRPGNTGPDNGSGTGSKGDPKPLVALQGKSEATPTESSGHPATPLVARPAPPPRQKATAPPAELQQSLLRQVSQTFSLDQSKTTEARLSLARQMLAKTAGPAMNPEERFVLLWQAGKLAAEAGDGNLMFQCVERIGEAFQIDALQIAKDLWKIMADTATETKRIESLLLAADNLLDEALPEGRLDVVQEINAALVKVAPRPAAKELRKQISQLRERLARLARHADDLRKAEEALRQSPDDGVAHLILGQCFCLLLDNWERGLPHLAECNDETLRTIAQAERRAAPSDQPLPAGKDLAAVGDLWWDYAQKAGSDFREPAKQRAGSWYQQALEEMDSGPQRTTVEKRLASLEKPIGAVREGSLPKKLTNSLGMQFVLIPAGQFLMGSTPKERDEALKHSREHYGRTFRERTEPKLLLEGVQKQVTIRSGFYLGVHEVTQAEYAGVMSNTLAPADDRNRLPAANVSWLDAVEFCKRLSARSAEQLHARVYRLPNEAEWEYACRAASQTARTRSRNFMESVWYSSNAEGKSHPVGSKQPNALGLYDMLGNVGEWCANRYSADSFNPSAAAGTPRPDDVRVVRGGAYTDGSLSCRPVWREDVRCNTRAPNIGFRVAMTPKP